MLTGKCQQLSTRLTRKLLILTLQKWRHRMIWSRKVHSLLQIEIKCLVYRLSSTRAMNRITAVTGRQKWNKLSFKVTVLKLNVVNLWSCNKSVSFFSNKKSKKRSLTLKLLKQHTKQWEFSAFRGTKSAKHSQKKGHNRGGKQVA